MTMQSTLHNECTEATVQEKLCLRCGEYWPETDEYFPRRKNGRLYSPCKCCIDERRLDMSETKSCVVPGCTNPRYHWRYARCWEHRQYLKVNPNPRAYRRKEMP